MKNIVCSGALAIALLVSSSAALAATATATQEYAVQYSPTIGAGSGGVPYQGVLKITTFDNGIIQGYYHLIGDTAHLTPVSGGQDADNNVWLQIGGRYRLHVTGRLDHGVLVGGANDQEGNQYTFTAKPNEP